MLIMYIKETIFTFTDQCNSVEFKRRLNEILTQKSCILFFFLLLLLQYVANGQFITVVDTLRTRWLFKLFE